MELLIVISIMLILMLLAVPSYKKFRIHSNELSAITSLKAIQTGQSLYTGAYAKIGYACDIKALGGEDEATNTASKSGMISGDLASGIKDGYTFTISCPQKADDSASNVKYMVNAVPRVPGSTGNRGFCMDEGGTIKDDPQGGTNCSELAQ
jgi:type IV pilus assembly protein PilA